MKYIRGLWKLTLFFIIVFSYLVIAYTGQLFIRDVQARHGFFTKVVTRVCRMGLWFLGIRVNVINPPPPDQTFLFVGNHLGILDIIILSSIRPTMFVTSVEMQQTPGLGLLCEMGGCLFVERRSRAGIHKEIEQMRNVLRSGHCIALYPEGTSTNGERVLPFKKSLLTAAAGTGVPILPMVVNYRKVNGEPMSDQWRDYVCWYGDQTFPPVFWRLLTMKSCEADFEFLHPIEVHSEEDRRHVAELAQAQITARYAPIPKPL